MSRPGVHIDNIADGETVSQRCILVNGQCDGIPGSPLDFIVISTTDPAGSVTFPIQKWPVCKGRFKALLLLSPGANSVTFQHYAQGKVQASSCMNLTYIPLLQNPPLHLAIMVAKDSPLTIDCPMIKGGGISSAHADLHAAIAKFRMTAYMWQALTAEDMNSRGLGRRSFRLEQEWTADTLSQAFPHAGSVGDTKCNGESAFRSTVKIHIVRSEKTVAELRQAQYAQQNPTARRKDDLHRFFVSALKRYGGPFTSAAQPIVAGLILDSTYSPSQDLVLAHAAMGVHHPSGISLGIFGSHLAYSWPRFMEEVPACLMDASLPGDDVCNGGGECKSLWEACAVGQSAFLSAVGGAFGASSDTGVMARGYARDWPWNFVSSGVPSIVTCTDGVTVVDGKTENNARWSLRDALTFRLLPHFRLTTDVPITNDERSASLTAHVEYGDGENAALVLESTVGIVHLEFNLQAHSDVSVYKPQIKLRLTSDILKSYSKGTKPLEMLALGMNGMGLRCQDVWKLFANTTAIRVPGSDVVLKKRAVSDDPDGRVTKTDQWDWAVLLQARGKDGKLIPATSIDIRVGCVLDGAIVHFQDRHHTVPCGPRWDGTGQHHHFGGHASERIYLPPGVDIAKVELTLSHSQFQGMRITLSDGSRRGELNAGRGAEVHVLEPCSGEKIVGFYGFSDWRHGWGGPHQFGIITAPKGIELPDAVYDMLELKNTDGETGPRPGRNSTPLPVESVQLFEGEQDIREGNVGQSGEEEEEEEEEEDGADDDEVGESFDTMEGEDFGPPGGFSL